MIKSLFLAAENTEILGIGDIAIKFISQVGFPIFMCVALFHYNQKRTDKLTDAVNNNTMVITKLLERLDND